MPADVDWDDDYATYRLHAGTASAAEARLTREALEMRRKPLSSTRSAKDITMEFTIAAGQLPPGELIKDAYFTLFEAVGALEVCSFASYDAWCIFTRRLAGLR
jgi:hypothetical protein